MKNFTLFLGALALFLTGCASPTERDQQAIVGSWRIIRAEIDGEPFRNAMDDIERGAREGKFLRVQFFENGTVKAEGGSASDPWGTYTLDAEKDPKWLTVTTKKGDKEEQKLSLYHLEGDLLRVAVLKQSTIRPPKLSGKDIMTMTLQREKP